MPAWGNAAVRKEAYGKVETGAGRVPRKFSIPKFKSRTFKQLKDPKAMYPKLEESTFKFYDFREDNTLKVEDRRPYIVFLDEHRVGEACQKEKKEYFRSISGLVLRMLVGMVILALILGCLWKLSKLF